MKKPLNVSRMNRRVIINDPPTLATDNYGGYTETAGSTSVVWAAVNRLRESTALLYGLTLSIAAYEITFRYEAAKALTLSHTLTYNGTDLTIANITDPDEDNIQLRVIAYERTT